MELSNNMRKHKKTKKQKLPSMVLLRRKAMRLWTEKVKDAQGRVCAICGIKDGTPNGVLSRKTGKEGVTYINSHHIEDRSNYALRFDLLNGIALCPSHHEFGKDSAHRAPVWFIDWLATHRPQVIEYVKKMRSARPQTALGYSREDMMNIIAELEKPIADTELTILRISQSQ